MISVCLSYIGIWTRDLYHVPTCFSHWEENAEDVTDFFSMCDGFACFSFVY